MAQRKRGEGRGLEFGEVALIKRMVADNFPRDRIMSFFVRPGRVISPAAISEITNGKIGPNIDAATKIEMDRFITTRLNEFRANTDVYGGPTSDTRVKEVLSLNADAQVSPPGFESKFCEYKRDFPLDRDARTKIAKTAASFANSNGGYIFFGVDDARNVVGIPDAIDINRQIHAFSQCINECFCPTFQWDFAVVPINGINIAVIYVYETQNKPVISIAELPRIIHKGRIYFRYAAITKDIEPGDLMHMLGERDRKTAAFAIQALPRDEDRGI